MQRKIAQLFTLFMVAFTPNIHAQIQTDSSDLPKSGEKWIEFNVGNAPGISLPSKGQNQVWDYSSL